MKKWWVKAILGLAVVLMAISLLLLGSVAGSRNRVEDYKNRLRAAGEKLKLEEIIPPRLPPGQNSVATVRDAMNRLRGWTDVLTTNAPPAMRLIEPGKAMIGWQQREIRDSQATNTWEDVELALEARADVLDSLRRLPEHPRVDFELDFRQGFALLLPHLTQQKGIALNLSAATICDLHRGNTAAAATNLHTALALANSWKDEPLVISQLVRIAISAILFNAQWELLQATNLTDAQLAQLQRDWTELEFLRPMESALVMERVEGSMTIQQYRTSNAPPGFWSSSGSGSGGSGDWLDTLKEATSDARQQIAFTLWRTSWSQTDELNLLKGNQVLVEAARQIRTNGYFKDALAEQDRQFAALGLNKVANNWLREKLDDDMRHMLSGPESLSKVLNRVLTIEISRQLAVTAIAIKRHTLRHGTPPDDLNALVPEFLTAVPRDPVDGKPLRYRLNADGTFTLYSIGEDGVDNGGDPTPDPPSRTRDLRRGRDFVWPQPATAEEVRSWEEKPASER